jgi:hypothetical protein
MKIITDQSSWTQNKIFFFLVKDSKYLRYRQNWVNFHDNDIMNATDPQTVMPDFGTCNSEFANMHININTQQ